MKENTKFSKTNLREDSRDLSKSRPKIIPNNNQPNNSSQKDKPDHSYSAHFLNEVL